MTNDKIMQKQSFYLNNAVTSILNEVKATHIENCQICKDNAANKAYFEKYGSWSPMLTTSSICEGEK